MYLYWYLYLHILLQLYWFYLYSHSFRSMYHCIYSYIYISFHNYDDISWQCFYCVALGLKNNLRTISIWVFMMCSEPVRCFEVISASYYDIERNYWKCSLQTTLTWRFNPDRRVCWWRLIDSAPSVFVSVWCFQNLCFTGFSFCTISLYAVAIPDC